MKISTRQLTTMAMLSALSFLVVVLMHVAPPIAPFAAAPFLTLDPKDVIIVIAGFLYGPLSAVLISIVVSLLEMITVSSTALYGCLMNIVSTCAFVCPAAFIYKKNKSIRSAVTGLAMGIVTMAAVMLLWNYIITPVYMGYPRQAVAAMLLPVFLPFNLLKGASNAALTMLLYKPVVIMLRKTRLVPESANASQKGRISIGTLLMSLFVLITLVLIILAVMGRLG